MCRKGGKAEQKRGNGETKTEPKKVNEKQREGDKDPKGDRETESEGGGTPTGHSGGFQRTISGKA